MVDGAKRAVGTENAETGTLCDTFKHDRRFMVP